jgi:hypothetical protein
MADVFAWRFGLLLAVVTGVVMMCRSTMRRWA